MILKGLFAGILFEKVEYMGLLAIPGETVVYHSWLELCQTRCFGVDCFQGVGVFGVGVDGAVDAEFSCGEWGD